MYKATYQLHAVKYIWIFTSEWKHSTLLDSVFLFNYWMIWVWQNFFIDHILNATNLEPAGQTVVFAVVSARWGSWRGCAVLGPASPPRPAAPARYAAPVRRRERLTGCSALFSVPSSVFVWVWIPVWFALLFCKIQKYSSIQVPIEMW